MNLTKSFRTSAHYLHQVPVAAAISHWTSIVAGAAEANVIVSFCSIEDEKTTKRQLLKLTTKEARDFAARLLVACDAADEEDQHAAERAYEKRTGNQL